MGRTKQGATSRSETASSSSGSTGSSAPASAAANRDVSHEQKLGDMLKELRTLIDNVAVSDF